MFKAIEAAIITCAAVLAAPALPAGAAPRATPAGSAGAVAAAVSDDSTVDSTFDNAYGADTTADETTDTSAPPSAADLDLFNQNTVQVDDTYQGFRPPPDNEAPTRGDSKARPVVFVHGLNLSENTDCTGTWKRAGAVFRAVGFTGPLVTFGYYKGDKHCSAQYNGTVDTSLWKVASAFANFVYKNYTNATTPTAVDVVAHSMGGLIVRAAIYGVAHNMNGFPPRIYIEDAVTMSTPHKGVYVGLLCSNSIPLPTQCRQLTPFDGFINTLNRDAQNPQSSIGTDWSLMGSNADILVRSSNAIGMNAGHTYVYTVGAKLSHSGIIKHNSKARTFHVKYTHAETGAKGTDHQAHAALYIAAHACYRWRSW